VITRSLDLAGIGEEDREGLARAVLRDVGDAPGELALLQMALWRTCAKAGGKGHRLVPAYEAIGRVEGALAQAAEEVFGRLLAEDQERAETLFVRLVYPGEAGGVTRRVARLAEFNETTQTLARVLADEKQWRLLVVQEETVEIAHEQLATQWQRYQRWIVNLPDDPEHKTAQDPRGDDLRMLQALAAAAARWERVEAEKRAQALAVGTDLELYTALAGRRIAWLSETEHRFVTASKEAEDTEERRTRRVGHLIRGLATAATIVAVVASVLASVAWRMRNEAVASRQAAEQQRQIAEQHRQVAESNADAERMARAEALQARDTAARARDESASLAVSGLLAESGLLRNLDSDSVRPNRRALAPVLESLRLSLEHGQSVPSEVTTALRNGIIQIDLPGRGSTIAREQINSPSVVVSKGVVVTQGSEWQLIDMTGQRAEPATDTGSEINFLATDQTHLFVAGSDGKLRAYLLHNSELVSESRNHIENVTGLVAIHDKVLVFTEEGVVHSLGRDLTPIASISMEVRRVLAVSPRSDALIGTSPTGIYVVYIDDEIRMTERRLRSIDFVPQRAAFSSDGRIIAVPAPAGGVKLVDPVLDLVIEDQVAQPRPSEVSHAGVVNSAFLLSSGQLEVLFRNGRTARIPLTSPRDLVDADNPTLFGVANIYSTTSEAWGSVLIGTDSASRIRLSGTGWAPLALQACRAAAWASDQWLTPLEAKAQAFCLTDLPRRVAALPPLTALPNSQSQKDLLSEIADGPQLERIFSLGSKIERFVPHRATVPDRNLEAFRIEYGIDGREVNVPLARRMYSDQARAGDTYAAYRLGRLDIDQLETQEQAVRFLRVAHEAGVAGATNSLGVAYLNGEGVSRNRSIAEELFRKAIELGDRLYAPFNLALMFSSKDTLDEQKALEYYYAAVDAGNPFAATSLVRSTARGLFPSITESEKLRLLRFAARFDATAALLLADALESQSGNIIPVFDEVRELYLRAAIAGVPQGLSYLGRLFERTMTESRGIIAELYRRAVVAGDRSAGIDLARVLSEAGAHPNEVSHWYRLAGDYSYMSVVEFADVVSRTPR
jgi:TPR repeat protein